MQRIATSTKAVDLYGAGKHGFKDGNLGLGIPPTDMEAAWCNGLQEELVNVIEAAGLVASGAALNQVVQAIAILSRQQTNTAFTTTGAAPNFVLTPSPAPTAYTAPQRFRVKFNVAGAGSDVINVSTLGNKSLKQYDNTGAKVAAVIATNQLADIEYDGVDFVILDPLPPTMTSAVQVGSIITFAGSAAPTGYLICPTAQTNLSRTTYAALFAAIGTTWGAGDGSTTFGMPWFPADYTTLQSSGNVGTQSAGSVIAHTHTFPGSPTGTQALQPGAGYYNILNAGSTGTTNSTGSAANIAAGARVLHCVKY